MIKASRKFKSPHYNFSVNTKGSWAILREIKEMDFSNLKIRLPKWNSDKNTIQIVLVTLKITSNIKYCQ